ncbi:MAG: DUF368 domain-containing protein [archaeon]|nr:DUF368 domain-containing protein [archaeon]
MQSFSSSVRHVIVGAVLGIASMLPGISGATMSVIFGVYERLVRDLADLRVWLRKDWRFILFLIIGAAIGTIFCAKVLDHALEEYPVPALMFFIGLILGQIPMLKRSVDNEEGTVDSRCWISFAIGIIVMLVMIALDIIGGDRNIVVSHDIEGFVIMVFIGMIVAVSALLPGLSHSTLLLVLGLMGTFTSAISDLDVFYLAPMVAGIIVAAILFSKIIHRALESYRLVTLMFILGLTLGSVLVIAFTVSKDITTVTDGAIGAVCLVIGLVVSLISMRMDRKTESEN